MHPQGECQPLDRFDTDRPLPSLDQTDVGSVEPGRIGESLLGHSALCPHCTDSLPKLLDEGQSRHN